MKLALRDRVQIVIFAYETGVNRLPPERIRRLPDQCGLDGSGDRRAVRRLVVRSRIESWRRMMGWCG